MDLKEILDSMVTEMENIGAVLSAIHSALIEKKTLDSSQIEAHVPNLQKEIQRRLLGIRASISELPD